QDGECEMLRELRSEKAFASHHVPDGGHQMSARAVLAHVSGRAGLQRTRCIRYLPMHAEDEDGDMRRHGAELRQDFEAGAVRKVEIEDHHIPLAAAYHGDRFIAAARFAADSDV